MKKLNHIGDNAEKLTNGLLYHFSMIFIFVGMFLGMCHVLNNLIDPCIEMLEKLAENALRIGTATVKILLVGVFMVAIYKVFFESENED